MYSPTESTEPTELLAKCIPPRNPQIYTELLVEYILPQISQIYTELLAKCVLPQISRIYTDCLGAEDSSGGILASATAPFKGLPQNTRNSQNLLISGVHLSQVHPLEGSLTSV